LTCLLLPPLLPSLQLSKTPRPRRDGCQMR
jgi:hypothetical protein